MHVLHDIIWDQSTDRIEDLLDIEAALQLA